MSLGSSRLLGFWKILMIVRLEVPSSRRCWKVVFRRRRIKIKMILMSKISISNSRRSFPWKRINKKRKRSWISWNLQHQHPQWIWNRKFVMGFLSNRLEIKCNLVLMSWTECLLLWIMGRIHWDRKVSHCIVLNLKRRKLQEWKLLEMLIKTVLWAFRTLIRSMNSFYPLLKTKNLRKWDVNLSSIILGILNMWAICKEWILKITM